MARSAIPSYFFVYAIVRHRDRFLFVKERDHTFYLPAGRVEPGESLDDAARREAREESGVDIELEGVLRVAHFARHDHSRMRVFFLGRPTGDPTPRTSWNGDTFGGVWLTLDEIRQKPLRADEALWACEAVAAGAPVYPLGLLVREGAPWRARHVTER